MGCRVIVGGYRVDKWGADACYLLRTEVLGWVDWVGWCDWVGDINCNGFMSSEAVGDHGIQRWRLCPGEASLLVIMHRKTCNEPFHVEVVLLRLSKDGKLTSKVVTNALVNPRDVDKFLSKLPLPRFPSCQRA
jgi:hypothetical protein